MLDISASRNKAKALCGLLFCWCLSASECVACYEEKSVAWQPMQ